MVDSKPDAETTDGPLSLNVLLTSSAISAGVFGGYLFYRSYLRRFATSRNLSPKIMRSRALLGKVTSVGDADNFHFFHTPGGYLAGWGWLRRVPKVNERGLKDQTLHIRLCGVDAPEASHFGKPAQPYSAEALEWLRKYILGRRVRVVPLSNDQYGRTVGEARVWKWNGRRNVSKEMLRNGWAVVYEGKTGAEFNGLEEQFKKYEATARRRRLGIFQKGRNIETPGEYKKKYS